MKINIKILLIILLCISLLVAINYKFFEWSTQKNLIEVLNSNLKKELALEEERSKYYETDAYPLLARWMSGEVTNVEEYIELSDKLIATASVANDLDKNLNSVRKEDKEKLSATKARSKWLIGSSRNFIRGVTTNLVSAYDLSDKSGQNDIIENSFIKQYFMVSKDMEISNEFFRKFPKDNNKIAQYVKDNFSQISSLEKYSRNDFKFEMEEDIKGLQPYGYEVLMKYKEYLKTFYLIMKDYVADDLESASYKATKISGQLAEFNIDFNKLFGENSSSDREMHQKRLEHQIKAVEILNGQKSTNKVYPVVGAIGNFNSNLFLCDLFISKAMLYKDIKQEYPKSQDSKSLVKEISFVLPRTDSVDGQFDYEYLIIPQNDEKFLKMECRDKEGGRTYSYTINK